MKKILNVTGVQKLSKEEQQNIIGSRGPRRYCDGPNLCCIIFANGNTYCGDGYCMGNGRWCVWL